MCNILGFVSWLARPKILSGSKKRFAHPSSRLWKDNIIISNILSLQDMCSQIIKNSFRNSFWAKDGMCHCLAPPEVAYGEMCD